MTSVGDHFIGDKREINTGVGAYNADIANNSGGLNIFDGSTNDINYNDNRTLSGFNLFLTGSYFEARSLYNIEVR